MDILHQILEIITQWYWIPVLLIYLTVIATILIENRNPTKTIAWVMLIIFIPVLGMVFYYLFGQKFKKVQSFKLSNQALQKFMNERWGQLNPILEANLKELAIEIGSLKRVYRFLVNQRVSPVVMGNKVDLLINGEEKFPALFEAIEAATHHINLEYYIFEPDGIGTRLIEVLERKASEGVEVRIIVDGFGSPRMSRMVRKLNESGLFTVVFLPVGFASLANSNYRNHRKFAIIDGQVAFIGGINISDYYLNPNTRSKVYWRDTSIRIEGYAVNVLQAYFWMDWHFAGGKEYAVTKRHLFIERDSPPGDAAVGFATSDPGSDSPYCMEALLIAIAEAETRIRLATPYYIPSEELSTALRIAASTGVEVELMIPSRGDSYIVQHASMSFLKPLLKRGVKVYLYKKGFLHAKTVTIDNKLAFVGTVNLDTRSFFINFETSAIISESAFCQRMNDQFELDIADSQLVTLETWLQRPRWKRGIDSICRLLAPLL